MPVVTFQRPDLCRLIGRDIPMDELTERMPMLGGDLDGVDGEAITIEWFPDRPDLLTLEGTGRALKAFLSESPGMPAYPVAAGRSELRVDASVAAVRPYAGLCFVRGVSFDEAYLKTVVDAQEKLTLAPGRKRRKIAIGVHDARGLEGPFTYTCVGPDEKPFVPLQETRTMTPAEILAEHPKGREYAHLLPDGRYPVFLDGAGEVISMPPVINAAKTALTEQTKDVLIDVTGTDAESVRRTIALLASGFAERGGRIESVQVHDASGTWSCPDLRPAERTLSVEYAQTQLGIELSGAEVADCLRRMGHDAEDFDTQVLVHSPAWRYDLLHDIDLVEDVAIGYGFERFGGSLPDTATFGAPLAHQAMEDRIRELMIGHGWNEARTLTLSNAADQWGAWGAPAEAAVAVQNPVLEEQTILRTRLAPSLLRVLSANRHRPLPHKLFEIGYVVDADNRNRLRLAVVEASARAGFSEAKGLAEALVRDLGLDVQLAPADEPGFVPGRQGHLAQADAVVGHFGELHPDILVHFDLVAATTALELDISALAGS